MLGNSHVQFSGGWARATASGYPSVGHDVDADVLYTTYGGWVRQPDRHGINLVRAGISALLAALR
jgi:hypothetical protein